MQHLYLTLISAGRPNHGPGKLRRWLIWTVLWFLSPLPLAATQVSQLTGVWTTGKDPYYLWVGDSWEGFTAKWKSLSKSGLRLTDIERYVEDGAERFAGVWRGGKGGHFLWKTTGWEAFTAKWKQLAKQNLRLIDIEIYTDEGKRVYLGVWTAGKDRYALWRANSWQGFTDKWTELSGQGLRLIDIEGHFENGATDYYGVFRAGEGGHFLWRTDQWSDFTAKWKELDEKKLRLIDYERIVVDGKFNHVGVFRSGSGGQALWRSEPEAFYDKWEELSSDNLRLVDLEITVSGGKPVTVSEPQPKLVSECNQVGPYSAGKELKGIAYGEDYSKINASGDSVFSEPNAVVKLVGGVCVQEGEVEYTLHYRSSAHRPVPLVETLKAGQCRCHWTNRAKGWPFEYSVRSTVKVKSPGTRYWHKLSVCYTPWRNRCKVKTWEGWK